MHSTLLSDQAIDWVVRLNSGDPDVTDTARFQHWRSQSIDHELAAQEAETLWADLTGVAGSVRRIERRQTMTRRSLLGFAGLFTLGAAAHLAGMTRGLFADYVTGVGEQREIALADGSHVTLNGHSALSVSLNADARRLTLHEGQAIFTVAHDPSRPFIVVAADGRARALGTVFDVDLRPGNVAVTVVEGRVEVTGADRQPVEVSANQQVSYGTETTQPQPVDAALLTAWHRGRLVFERRQLDSVLAELARYRNGNIVVLNPRLAAMEISGTFNTADTDSVLAAIEQMLPVRIERLPMLTILH